MNFPPEVEQWRGLVSQYFPSNLVDKALWVIQYESGGNPSAAGDGGVARGLFQIQDSRAFSSRPSAAWLDNPENNIAYAAQTLGAAKGNFAPWGENNSYQGKPFGALGNHPFPEGQVSAQSSYMSNPELTRHFGSNPPNPESALNAPARAPHPAGTTVTAGPRAQAQGNPEQQLYNLATLRDQAWNAFDQYIYSQGGRLVPNYNNGMVLLAEDMETNDPQGTALLQSALGYDQQFDRLSSLFESGLYSMGKTSAATYYDAEPDKAAEAEREYNDYLQRVSDIFNIESAEGKRATEIEQAASAASDQHIKAKEAAKLGIAIPDATFRFPGQEEGKSFRTGIRETLKGRTAPAFHPLTFESGWRGGGYTPPNFGPAGLPDYSQIPEGHIPLGPAGFTPEQYIQDYLLPNIQPVGSRGYRSGVLDQ